MATPNSNIDSYVGLIKVIGSSTKNIPYLQDDDYDEIVYGNEDNDLNGFGFQVVIVEEKNGEQETLVTSDYARFRRRTVVAETLFQNTRAFNGRVIFSTTGKVKTMQRNEDE